MCKDVKLGITKKVYDLLSAKNKVYVRKYGKSPSLDYLVFMLLLGYSFFNQSNNQLGVPRKVKDKFRTETGVNFEVMSSALNHHYDYYCSLFYDIEKYFMSCGPIGNVYFIRGTFAANPPYEGNLLNSMVDIFQNALEESEKEHLFFLFGLPAWMDLPASSILTKK